MRFHSLYHSVVAVEILAEFHIAESQVAEQVAGLGAVGTVDFKVE